MSKYVFQCEERIKNCNYSTKVIAKYLFYKKIYIILIFYENVNNA